MRIATRIASFALAALLTNRACSRADTFYVADYIDGIVYKFDSTIENTGTEFAQFEHPYALAADISGNVYVAGSFTNTIVKFDIDGNGKTFSIVSTNGVNSLAFDPAGNLYASSSTGTIYRINSQGVASVFSQAGIIQPVGMVFDASTNLYVDESTVNGTIYKFDRSGNKTVFATNGLVQPLGMSFDASGNLWVGNNGAQNVIEFDTLGNGTVFNTGFYHNTGVGFDRNGTLYVSAIGSGGFIAAFEPSQGSEEIYSVFTVNDPITLVFAPPTPVPLLHITNVGPQTIVYWQDDHQSRSLQTTLNLTLKLWTNAPALNWTNYPYIGLAITNPPIPLSALFRLR